MFQQLGGNVKVVHLKDQQGSANTVVQELKCTLHCFCQTATTMAASCMCGALSQL